MSLGGIAAPDDLRLRIANVIEAIGHCAIAPGIRDAGHRRRMADPRLVVGIVGAPEGTQFTEQIGPLIGEFRRAEPIDRIRPRLLADCEQPVADLVDCLIPADARPLAADELQRVFEPPLARHELAHGGALGAMRAAVDRAVPARLLADPDTVRDLGRDGAADGAMSAHALARDDLCTRSRRRPGLGPTHAAERQCPERRQGTRRDPRSPQEAAAVEAAIRLVSQGRERAAAHLALGSPDQHRAPPYFGYRLTR